MYGLLIEARGIGYIGFAMATLAATGVVAL